MADAYIIVVDTYGSQRVTAPQTGTVVSAYKMGYTSAVTAVLLALYGEKARDVSPTQASYRYVQIDGEVVVWHGHILLTLTADELAKAEQITRHAHRAGVFLWRDKEWWAFPDASHPDYTEPGYRTGPTFDPTSFRPPSPSTGEREHIITGIWAERSQREDGGAVWWWLKGETYPHRELLKRYGARFSGKRREWYYVGANLPTAIQALLTDESQPEDHSPNDQSGSLLAIFGGRLIGTERAHNGDLIVRGENGVFATRTTWYDRDDQPESVWVFDLPHDSTHGNRTQPIHDALKAAGAQYSYSSFKWHFDQAEKVAALDRLVADVPLTVTSPVEDDEPCSLAEAAAILGLSIKPTTPAEPIDAAPEPDAPPAIRIIKPTPFPIDGESLDPIQSAIRDTPHTPTIPMPTVPTGRLTHIEQAFCGELTGSITGSVFCYGYGVHDGVCIYLNLAGPRLAVEAIRAKLSKGDIVSVVPMDAPSVELTAGEGNSGMYHAYLHYLPEARFASMILLHDWAVTPNYGGKSTTFIVRTSESQAMAKLKHHITHLVNIPVFEAWSAYLYEAGQRAMLVRNTRSAGGIDLLSIDLDLDAWTRLITGGLEQRVISLYS